MMHFFAHNGSFNDFSEFEFQIIITTVEIVAFVVAPTIIDIGGKERSTIIMEACDVALDVFRE